MIDNWIPSQYPPQLVLHRAYLRAGIYHSTGVIVHIYDFVSPPCPWIDVVSETVEQPSLYARVDDAS